MNYRNFQKWNILTILNLSLICDVFSNVCPTRGTFVGRIRVTQSWPRPPGGQVRAQALKWNKNGCFVSPSEFLNVLNVEVTLCGKNAAVLYER